MDTPRPTGDRVPLGDLTNTTHEGNRTRPGLVTLDWDPNEHKRRRERERYATMSDENRSEINKKRRHVDLDNNMVAHSTDGNTTNEMDKNSDWLHRHSTYSNDLQQLSDGPVPLSSIAGTAGVDDTDTKEDIITIYESGPINWLVTCQKERKRDRDRARNAAMSPEQRALLNKRRRELYATKRSAKMLEMTPKETAQSTDGFVPLSIGVPGDIDDGLIETDINTVHEMGAVNASSSIDNIVTCPKERRRELDRARRAAMSPKQKAQTNKRRRELYAAKNASKNAARKLQMTPQEKKLKRKESNKKYNMMVREQRANNLHPDSLAMESPHFNPQLIFPSSPQSPSHDMEIPELRDTTVDIAPSVVQNLEVQTPELSAAQTIHRHRVTTGERNALLSRRNRAFEANIGRRARGCADGKCNDSNDPTQPSVIYNDGVTQETPVPPPNNCTGTQTQPSVVDGTFSMSPNVARDHTPDEMVEDDYDKDVIFEEDEEEDEAYFFARQGKQQKEGIGVIPAIY